MFSEKIHRYIYLFGLFGLGFGMMIGTVPTSIPQIILISNWLLEGDFKRKWEQLRFNRIFWVMAAVWLIHVIGLTYTSDMADGIKDVRTKIPLLLLPFLLFSSKPISLKEFYGILYCFIAGCVVNTAWCLLYSFVLHKSEVVRDASRFMSHIRLGLYLNIGIAACVYFAVKTQQRLRKIGFILLAVYFILVLYKLGLASGLMNFVILFTLAVCVGIYRQGTLVKVIGFTVLAGFLALILNYIYTIHQSQTSVRAVKNNTLQNYSPSGRPYLHFDIHGQKENGHYIHINVQPEELQREWKKQFPADSFHYDAQHNMQRYSVLIRYMASLGLNKDSAGFAALSAEDKQNIRKDIANYEYQSWSFLHKRTYELVNEYDEFVNHRYVNGHSLTMRLYFWKAAAQVIREHPVFGTGTGDVQQELNAMYKKSNSPLEEEWYKRPHNQFLTMMVALGIPGLLVFLVSISYPAMTLKKQLSLLYWPFLIIAIISFFLEDTLETQAGLTFYAYFNTLFIVMAWNKMQGTEPSAEIPAQE